MSMTGAFVTSRGLVLRFGFVAACAGVVAVGAGSDSAAQARRGDDGGVPRAGTRKLIEFGWDEPDAATITRDRARMAASPFDGCVYHVNTATPGKAPESLTWKGWGKRTFRLDEFGPALAHSGGKDGKGFDENFLRFNVTPGDFDWFDDHSAVIANARVAAILARGGAGILLDTEQYEGQLFDHRKLAARSGRSWEDYQGQVRRRGREVMAAFREGFPGIKVMLTFGHSLAWRETDGGRKPLRECPYGLLVPFVDGLIEAATGDVTLIDGYEPSYGFLERKQFEEARRVIRSRASELAADPAAYRRVMNAGFGLWLDHDWRNKGWSVDRPESNHFSPDRFRTALGHALACTDEYVWIYTETPRWWTEDGEPKALPTAYIDTVRQALAAARGDHEPSPAPRAR